MSAYIMFNYEITDRSRIEELSRRSKISDVNSKYKSKLIAATCVETVEGKTLPLIVMGEWTAFWIVIAFIVGKHAGWRSAHITVADECEKLGRFYVRKTVYECTAIKEKEQG